MEKFKPETFLESLLQNKYLTKHWRITPRKKNRVKQSIFFITRDFPRHLDFKYRLRALRAGVYKYKDIKCPVDGCSEVRKLNRKYHLASTCGSNDEQHKEFLTSKMSLSCKNSRTNEERLISAKKAKETFIKKYGVDNPMKSKEIQKKAKDTNLKKYGVKFPTQSKEIIQKRKANNFKKYGIDEPAKLPEIKEKAKNTCLQKYGVISTAQHPAIKEKIFKTNLEKYGVKIPTQNKEIQKKLRNTNLKKYGVSCVFAAPKIKRKIEKTNLEKYGVKNYALSSEYKLRREEIEYKIRQTNLKKYGVPHPKQTHFKNISILTKEYVKKYFLDKNMHIKMQEMCKFFNISETACYRFMHDNDIPFNYKAGGFNPNKPATLYYLLDQETGLYKIGVTNKSVEERFPNTDGSKRNMIILEQTYYENGYEALKAEQEILEAFSYCRCINESWPEAWGGRTEFFKEDILLKDINYEYTAC